MPTPPIIPTALSTPKNATGRGCRQSEDRPSHGHTRRLRCRRMIASPALGFNRKVHAAGRQRFGFASRKRFRARRRTPIHRRPGRSRSSARRFALESGGDFDRSPPPFFDRHHRATVRKRRCWRGRAGWRALIVWPSPQATHDQQAGHNRDGPVFRIGAGLQFFELIARESDVNGGGLFFHVSRHIPFGYN